MVFMKPTILLALPLMSGLALVQAAPRQEPTPPAPQQEPTAPATQQVTPTPTPEPPTTGTKEVGAEVVSTDAAAKTITVKIMVKKDAASEAVEQQGTIPVDAEAVTSLDSVKAGDKIKLLCRMNDTKVIAVKAVKKSEPAKTETPPKP